MALQPLRLSLAVIGRIGVGRKASEIDLNRTMQDIEEWAKGIGGRFASILELKKEGQSLFARIRTHFAYDGVLYRIPDDVRIPRAYRAQIDRGEIDRREIRDKD